MSLLHAAIAGVVMTAGGALYLGMALNALTGWLSLATAVVYLGAYTPLKKVHPICTFVGAFPGAMPGLLGWTAARGRLEWGALVMFAIVFFWQFPHFFSIAWLYREDYAAGAIRMLPVVESGWPLDGAADRGVFDCADSGHTGACASGDGRKNLFCGSAAHGVAVVVCRTATNLAGCADRGGRVEAARAATAAGHGFLFATVVPRDDAGHDLVVNW